MKKQEQLSINTEIERGLEKYSEVFLDIPHDDMPRKIRLNNCQAWTQDFETITVLWSYNTVVAVYDKLNGTLYDILRAVYGYTATSAQHIAKFRNIVRPAHVLTYREV